jgi:uncharacterized membrane protein YhhN
VSQALARIRIAATAASPEGFVSSNQTLMEQRITVTGENNRAHIQSRSKFAKSTIFIGQH